MVTEKKSKIENGNELQRREFCKVIDWDLYQYSDVRKKPNPPWRWFRIQRALLVSPEWLSMTPTQKVDFVHVLGAASETGNMIPIDRNWLRVRQLSQKKLKVLKGFSILEFFSLPPDDPKIRRLRQILSGAIPPPEAEADIRKDSPPANTVPDLDSKNDEEKSYE